MPRAKKFREEDVLEKAMELFWKKGFHATSMQDLVNHMGINRASMYDTFGDKERLYLRAFEKYRRKNRQQILDFLASYASVQEGLKALFLSAVQYATQDADNKGCFVVNCTTEMLPGHPGMLDLLVQNRKDFETFFLDYLKQGVQKGEIDHTKNLKATAAYLFTLYNGLKVVAKITPSAEHLEQVVEVGLQALD